MKKTFAAQINNFSHPMRTPSFAPPVDRVLMSRPLPCEINHENFPELLQLAFVQHYDSAGKLFWLPSLSHHEVFPISTSA